VDPYFFDYPNVRLIVEPSCGGGPSDTVTLTTQFMSPCSPVSIIAPNSNWVINDDTTKLFVTIQDYDTENINLEDATLQFRRLGSGSAWQDVPVLEVDLGNPVSRAALIDNDSTFVSGEIPFYNFIWTIPNDQVRYPDGDYELRVLMDCNNFSSTLSNTVQGKISRLGLQLFGSPQPADAIWTQGDEISFTFNKDIDCALLNPQYQEENLWIVDETTGDTLDYQLSCYANKLIFTLDSAMSNFDGHLLRVHIDDVIAIEGNISEVEEWSFRVITQKAYWANADTVRLRMYQGETLTESYFLASNTALTLNNLSIVQSNLESWVVQVTPSSPFTLTPSGLNVSMDYYADPNLGLGTFYETFEVQGPGLVGQAPKLHVELEILANPPRWEVDPNDFDASMTIISNWRYTTSGSPLSNDTRDLISVWAGNEIRGKSNIISIGDFYVAYMTVYGNVGDTSELSFRVWDADLGLEFDAHANRSIPFDANTTLGSTANPENIDGGFPKRLGSIYSLKSRMDGFLFIY
jgi:hypothetical protein